MMDRRENFKKIVNHEEGDHVPIDLGSHVASIHQNTYRKLKAYLNDPDLKNEDAILDRMVQNVVPDEKLLQRYNVDFRWLFPHWVGVTDVSEEEYQDMWGIRWQYMQDAYMVNSSPLTNATIEDIERHPWPDPEDPRLIAGLAERAKHLYKNTDYVLVGDAIKGGILTKALQIRGYEQMFADLVDDIPLAEALMDKLLEVYKQFYSAFLRAVGPYIDMIYFTDDIGGQNAMMISPTTFRTLVKPRIAELIDHIKSEADVKFLYHTCGTVAPVVDDIIDMGVDILNPIQTSAMGMDTDYLKEMYGDRICFHGGIDVQQMMPFSTPEEVRFDVAKRIHQLGRGGGYILATCHNMGSDIPPINVETMFEAAKELGRYPLNLDSVLSEADKKLPTEEELLARRSRKKVEKRGRQKVLDG